MTKFKVIGLSGKAGSGKDFISETFFLPAGYKLFSLAWHLKVWAIGRGVATREEVFVTKPPQVRKLLQEDGTERGRNIYGENVWTNVATEWLTLINQHMGIDKFIIPDIRFANEIEFVHSLGGEVYRIHAPKRADNNKLTDEQRQHKSETALDNYEKFDGYIMNDPEYSHTLRYRCEEIMDYLDGNSDYSGEFRIADHINDFMQDIKNRWWF